MAFQAGSAFVQILPSMRGVQRTIGRQMVPIGTTAGRNLSRTVGTAAAAAAPAAMVPVQRTITSRIGGAAKAATAGVASSFKRMGTAATASLSTATGAAAGMSGQLASMARMAGGLAAAVGLFQLGRSAVSSATNVERARAAITGLYGDAQAADQVLRRLRDVARDSPIEFSAFVSGAESLAYMGIQGEQAITVLQRIETAMVASGKGGESFEQVTEAMLAMVNQGKASAEEINRMSQAGFPAWEMLAEHMDMSIDEIREAVTAGKIGIDDMVGAMEAGAGPTFQKMVAAQQEATKTLSATWARVKDNIVVSLGEMVAPLVSRLTPALNRAGQALTGAFSAAPRVFGRFTDAVVSSGVAAAVGNIGRGVRDLAQGALPALRPLVTTVAGAFAALVVALNPVADLMSWVGDLMRGNTGIIEYMGAALGGMVTAIIAIRVATAAWAVVQGVLNTVMAANPISLVIIAVAALVAAVIYAYKNFDWFRTIVQGAWDGIKAVAMAVWNGALKPIFDALGAAISWITDHWKLLSTVFLVALGPIGLVVLAFTRFRDQTMAVLKAVGKALAVLGAVIFTVLVTPFIVAFNVLSAVVRAWWDNVVRPVWDAVAAAARWLWEKALRPAFDAIAERWRMIMQGIKVIWETVLRPAWNAVQAAAQWLWRNVLEPVFDAIALRWKVLVEGIKLMWQRVLKPVWDAVQAAARWMWRNVLQPIFDAIGRGWNALGTGIRWVWRNVIKPAWDALVGGLRWVRDRFGEIVDWVGRKWDQLRGLLARPINAIIRTVFNAGIVPAWNFAANLLGIGKVEKLKEFRWARGGIHEDHRAQVTRAGGPVRIWSEPETGGEAYIPLARSKRRRSTGILADVADRFGMAVVPNDLALFADGGLWRRMWGVVSDQFPQARRTSAYRPGDPGYHGSGRAIDVAGPRPMDMGAMLRINQWLGREFANSTQLIHTQPGAMNLLHGRPHHYNAGVRADHRDHVHWALENAAMLGGAQGSDGGWFGGLRAAIRAFFEKITNPLIDKLPKAPPQWANLGRGLATKARDSLLDFLLGKADESDGANPAAGSGPVRRQVQDVARRFGWGGGHQWNRLDELIRRESSWNPRAQNPISTAYGLYQFLDSTWATVGGHKTSNPGLQAEFGNRYIRQRYGNPAAAVAFHDRNNWYDQGGALQPGWNLAYNGTRRPEPVLTDAQWRDISRAANGEGGDRHYHLTVYDAGNNRVDLQAQFKRLELQAGV